MTHMYNPFTGYSPLEHESRLCFDGNRERLGGIGGSAKRFIDEMVHTFGELTGSNEAQNEQVKANIRSENNWARAFDSEGIFESPRVELDTTIAYGPLEILQDMEPNERRVEFIRFMRGLVPTDLRDEYIDLGFGEPAFRDYEKLNITLDMYMDIVREGQPIEFLPGEQERLLLIQKMILGEDIRDGREKIPVDAENIAFITLKQRYWNKKDGLQTSIKDYEKAIAYIRDENEEAHGKPIDSSLLENVSFLIKRLPPSKFRGALQHGVIKNTDLSDRLGKELRRKEEERHEKTHEARMEWNDLNKRKVQKEMREKGKTFRENWNDMGGKEKLFAVALAVYFTHKMLKSNSKIARNFPLLIGGVYLYRRMVMGDPEPLNNMGTGFQNITTRAWFPIRKALEKMKILVPDSEANALPIMVEFLGKQQNTELLKAASPFAALSQVKLSSIADSVKITPTAVTFDVKPGDPLDTEIGVYAKREGISKAKILEQITENKEQVTEAMGYVMFLIGLGTNKHGGAAQALKNAGINGYKDIKAIKDPDKRKKLLNLYIPILQAGKEKASSPSYGTNSFVDVIQDFQEIKSVQAKQDNADIIPDPFKESNRKSELNFIEQTRSTPISLTSRQEVTKSEGLLDLEITESISNMVQLGLVTPDAEKILIDKFNIIREDKKIPLRDILLNIERLKYSILVSSLYAKKLPINADEIDKMTDGADSASVWSSILSTLNRSIGVSSHFGKIDSLENIKTILAERTLKSDVRSIDSSGFKALTDRIDRYQAFFHRLRTTHTLNPSLLAEVQEELGDKEKSEAFLEQIFGMPNKEKRIGAMEQYLAQRMANEIALAMLTQHRVNAENYTLEREHKKRLISPKEEKNLLIKFDKVFEFLADRNGYRSKERGLFAEGSWEMLDILDSNIDIEKVDKTIDLDGTGTYSEAHEKIKMLSHVWFTQRHNGNKSVDSDDTEAMEAAAKAKEASEVFEGDALSLGSKIRTHIMSLRDGNPSITLNPPNLFNIKTKYTKIPIPWTKDVGIPFLYPSNRGENAQGYIMAKFMATWLRAIGKPDHKALADKIESILGKGGPDTIAKPTTPVAPVKPKPAIPLPKVTPVPLVEPKPAIPTTPVAPVKPKPAIPLPKVTPLAPVINYEKLATKLTSEFATTVPNVQFRKSVSTSGNIEYGVGLITAPPTSNLIASSPAATLEGKTPINIQKAYLAWMRKDSSERVAENDPFK